ncbi:hypothetical protein GALL_396230 [mine drainage metagenome]|uniref:Uncharacterized protein n=1 Tax=mine drainage metagenome TaxID=410659 RepID=A0A1J5Q4Q9_9ZZZZ
MRETGRPAHDADREATTAGEVHGQPSARPTVVDVRGRHEVVESGRDQEPQRVDHVDEVVEHHVPHRTGRVLAVLLERHDVTVGPARERPVGRCVATVERDHQRDAGRPREPDELPGAREIQRERLVDQHRHAGAQERGDDLGVRLRRGVHQRGVQTHLDRVLDAAEPVGKAVGVRDGVEVRRRPRDQDRRHPRHRRDHRQVGLARDRADPDDGDPHRPAPFLDPDVPGPPQPRGARDTGRRPAATDRGARRSARGERGRIAP